MKIIKPLLGVAFVVLVTTTNAHPPQEKVPAKSHSSEFRYVIVKNSPLHDGRLIFILLDEKSFSETTLKELFRLVSKRFPQPDELHAVVYTSLEQVATPEEEDHQQSLPYEQESLPDPNIQKHPAATYIRWEGNESFSYSLNGRERTVILKGKDLLHQKK